MPEGGEREKQSEAWEKTAAKTASVQTKVFHRLLLRFSNTFSLFARHFFNLLRCIFNNGSSSRIRRRSRCSSCFFIYFHHTHTLTHTHTPSTCTHSFCEDFPRCLKLAYVENGGRPKEMHADTLSFSPLPLPPFPLALFNCIYRNKKKWRKLNRLQRAHTHKKNPNHFT